MASLLERMNINPSTGPARTGSAKRRSDTGPYNRLNRPPKGDPDSAWSHDLYDDNSDPNSLSARLSANGAAPKANVNFSIAQKALKAAVSSPDQLTIKGAGNSSGNVVQVEGLSAGTTADDVAAIFKSCGEVTSAKLVPGGPLVKVRVQFKSPSSASAAVKKFHNQAADGGVLTVTVVGSHTSGTSLGSRLGGKDGLGVVRNEGSVDVLMGSGEGSSKMRSDSLIKADPRAQVLVAPPGTNPLEYTRQSHNDGRRRGGPGGALKRRMRGGMARMDTD